MFFSKCRTTLSNSKTWWVCKATALACLTRGHHLTTKWASTNINIPCIEQCHLLLLNRWLTINSLLSFPLKRKSRTMSRLKFLRLQHRIKCLQLTKVKCSINSRHHLNQDSTKWVQDQTSTCSSKWWWVKVDLRLPTIYVRLISLSRSYSTWTSHYVANAYQNTWSSSSSRGNATLRLLIRIKYLKSQMY